MKLTGRTAPSEPIPGEYAVMMDSTGCRVLVVEDHVAKRSAVVGALVDHQFVIQREQLGPQSLRRIVEGRQDAVVFDVDHRLSECLTVCRSARHVFAGPMMILVTHSNELDEVRGLEVGADDFLVKPVHPQVLAARLRSQMQRSRQSHAACIRPPVVIGSLTVDPTRRDVVLAGRPVELSTAEFDLLLLLAENAGRPMSRSEICQQLQGVKYDGLDRSIDLRVSRLRKKLGEDPARPERLKSVRGFGYMLCREP